MKKLLRKAKKRVMIRILKNNLTLLISLRRMKQDTRQLLKKLRLKKLRLPRKRRLPRKLKKRERQKQLRRRKL